MSFSFLTAYIPIDEVYNTKVRRIGLEFCSPKVYLEIAAAEEEIDFGVVNLFMMMNCSVNNVKVSMHTPFYCNLHLSQICFYGSSWGFTN